VKKIAFILLVIYQIFIFRTFTIIFIFYQNQEYIATELCEQREVLNNTCQGNCHLQKQINKLVNEENSQQNTNNIKQTIEENSHSLTSIWKFTTRPICLDLVSNTVYFFSVKSVKLDPKIPPPKMS